MQEKIGQTNDIKMVINVPMDEALGKSVVDALNGAGRKLARQLVEDAMTQEIEKIISNRISDITSLYAASTALGKKIQNMVIERLEKIFAEIHIDKNELTKKVRERLQESEKLTNDYIDKKIEECVNTRLEKLQVMPEFTEQVKRHAANIVRSTYPIQMAQMLDNEEKIILKQRIAELEARIKELTDKKEG